MRIIDVCSECSLARDDTARDEILMELVGGQMRLLKKRMRINKNQSHDDKPVELNESPKIPDVSPETEPVRIMNPFMRGRIMNKVLPVL